MSTIGIAELSHRGSELVRMVEQDGAEFDLTRQGRDTGVVLTRKSRLRSTPTAKVVDLAAVLSGNGLDEKQIQARLDEIDLGRDESGAVG
ncbi:hypothetical protein ACWDPV_21170 [Gordonia sp. NPDC003504]